MKVVHRFWEVEYDHLQEDITAYHIYAEIQCDILYILEGVL